MLLRSCLALCLLPLLVSGFLFPSGGGGSCCCGAPACSAPISSCGGGCSGGYSGGGYSSGGYSGYAQPQIQQQASYASVPQASYIAAPQPSYSSIPSVGYAKSSAGSYSASIPSGPAPSYNAPAAPSTYSNAPLNVPPPPPSVEQVSPANAESYNGHAAASGNRLQAVEEEEANDSAVADAIASSLNSTVASEASPPVDISLLKLTNNPECNSEELKEIIIQNMTENLNTSKRLIQVAAEAKFGGRFDVVCSQNDFSYVTNTELYCQETQNHVSCYAYRQL